VIGYEDREIDGLGLEVMKSLELFDNCIYIGVFIGYDFSSIFYDFISPRRVFKSIILGSGNLLS
jgi:hypothetical protein